MIKPTISTTPYGVSLDIEKRGIESAAFLAKNRDCILGLDGAEYLQSSVRPTVSTPLVDIYNKAAELGKLQYFTMFNVANVTDVPTLLTLKDIAVDGKYISSKMPTSYQNVWINLTPILGMRDAYNRNLQITDQIEFANQVARGLLCMSFNDSESWLTPTIQTKIIDVYSLLFTSHLKNRYNLDLNEVSMVRVLFAAYMAQMLGCEDVEIPPVLNRYDLLKLLIPGNPTPRALAEIFEKFHDVRQKINPNTWQLSIGTICKILQKVGPGRMEKLTDRTLYVFMSRSPMDNQNMMVAMDYPPYFVYLMLQNIRGGKNPMFQNLMKFGDTKKRAQDLADEMLSCKLFIDKVVR